MSSSSSSSSSSTEDLLSKLTRKRAKHKHRGRGAHRHDSDSDSDSASAPLSVPAHDDAIARLAAKRERKHATSKRKSGKDKRKHKHRKHSKRKHHSDASRESSDSSSSSSSSDSSGEKTSAARRRSSSAAEYSSVALAAAPPASTVGLGRSADRVRDYSSVPVDNASAKPQEPPLLAAAVEVAKNARAAITHDAAVSSIVSELRAHKQQPAASSAPAEKPSAGRSFGPLAPQDYHRLYNTIERVYDPGSGRVRSQRATGEIIETIVSRDEQMKLRKIATMHPL